MTPNIQFNRGAIDAGSCISGGWELIKSNYWVFFLMTLIFAGCSIALSCIPIIGGISFQILLAPAITVGIYYSLFRQMRGEAVDVGMMFRGFDKFGVVIIVGLIQSIPTIIWTVLNLVLNVGSNLIQVMMPKMGKGYSNQLAAQNDAAPMIAGGVIIVILLVVIVAILFSIAWGVTFYFALPIVTEYDVTAIEAIKLSASAGWGNLGGIILLAILQFLVIIVGLIALCFGVLFVLPVIYAATALAYRMVFPPGEDTRNYNPPPPTAYQAGGFGQY